MKVFSSIVALLLVLVAQASAAPSVVITGVHTNLDSVTYSVTVKDWSIDDKTPTACHSYYTNGCNVYVALVYPNGTFNVSELSWYFQFSSFSPLTVGDVLSRLNKLGVVVPFNTTIKGYLSYNPKCIELRAFSYNGSSNVAISSCIPVVTPPVKCDIDGYTTIDHKTLADDKLEGAQTSTQLNLKCTGGATVVVKADRTNSYGVRLRNNDSLYSEIKVNGKDATSGITVPVTSNVSTALTITSTLKTRGSVAPGPFSGSTVITVSPN